MQRAWTLHGADSFSYEVLERLELEDGVTPYIKRAKLKEQLAAWQARMAGG